MMGVRVFLPAPWSLCMNTTSKSVCPFFSYGKSALTYGQTLVGWLVLNGSTHSRSHSFSFMPAKHIFTKPISRLSFGYQSCSVVCSVVLSLNIAMALRRGERHCGLSPIFVSDEDVFMLSRPSHPQTISSYPSTVCVVCQMPGLTFRAQWSTWLLS